MSERLFTEADVVAICNQIEMIRQGKMPSPGPLITDVITSMNLPTRAASPGLAERGFHSRDGFYYKRVRNGRVIVSYWRGDDRIGSAELAASEWASVVASTSQPGENADTYHAALAFHNDDAARP
jgi:hypothetical protein